MNISNENLLKVLNAVKYPENGTSIVSLEMVDEIKIEGNKISFTLFFPQSFDPLTSKIVKECEKIISLNLKNVEIQGNIVAKPKKLKPQNNNPKALLGVKNIIGVASGKGGVGKSTVTTNLAVALAQAGHKVGLIDADIFGPSIPKMFNVEEDKPEIIKKDGIDTIIPIQNYGVKLCSIGFFVPKSNATIWRGPMASSSLKQIIEQSEWGELDYLLIDLPPGTSDIHLTIVQSLSLTGVVIVSTPQEVALIDAIKGINMFTTEKIKVPILGLVENMAWFTPEELPDNKYYIFGKDGVKNLSQEMNVPLLGQIPLVQSIREDGDIGTPSAIDTESIIGKSFYELSLSLIKEVEKRNSNFEPTKIVQMTS